MHAMKFFDLSFPVTPSESSPKIHKIFFEDFRKAYRDMDRSLAESLVEKGMAKWLGCGVNGVVAVPQAMIAPMEFFVLNLPTHAVKAIHVNDLVPSNGPSPNDVVAYGENLIRNMRFSHLPEDIYDADAYDESLEDPYEDDLLPSEPEVPLKEEKAEKPKPEVKKEK